MILNLQIIGKGFFSHRPSTCDFQASKTFENKFSIGRRKHFLRNVDHTVIYTSAAYRRTNKISPTQLSGLNNFILNKRFIHFELDYRSKIISDVIIALGTSMRYKYYVKKNPFYYTLIPAKIFLFYR